MSSSKSEAEFAVVLATIDRPHVVQRFIRTVRARFPDVAVYVADQSVPTQWQVDFYKHYRCSVIWMDHDAGVCASRNAAVAEVKQKYFLLCDDDFIITNETDLDPVLAMMEDNESIGIVGGRLIDMHVETHPPRVYEYQRFWELLFLFEPDKQKLVAMPVHYFAPEPTHWHGGTYYECDAVMNFAVFRTAAIGGEIRWDPRFKSNGEHEDFFLNFKINSHYRVVYTPDLVGRHHHPPLKAYSGLRHRSHGWQIFLDKWSIRQYLELDGGLRVVNSVDRFQKYGHGYEQYYSSLPLVSYKGSTLSAGQAMISNIDGTLLTQDRVKEFAFQDLPGTDYRIFDIGLDGRIVYAGGKWQLNSPIVLVNQKDFDNPLRDSSVGDLSFLVGWPTQINDKSDLFLYLQPSCAVSCTKISELLASMTTLVSVAFGSSYCVYREQTLAHDQTLVLDTWNAVLVPLPIVSYPLTIEITVCLEEVVVFEASRLITGVEYG